MMKLWNSLHRHAETLHARRIVDLFSEGDRAAEFSLSWDGFLFDYAKTNIDVPTRRLLLQLAERSGLQAKRAAMFAGARINETEGRAVLHVALRQQEGQLLLDGHDVMPKLRATRARMRRFADDVRSGHFKGPAGAITDVVNIGIGGSDLGPAMAVAALAPYHDGPRCHFVSNVDGAHIHDVLRGLDPQTTLFIVASKTFTTIETMTNAETARRWMAARVERPFAQFVGVCSLEDRAAAYGIDRERIFGFEDWVGGRYSLWGPVGLSLMLAIGPDDFDDFLQGGARMDAHFQAAPLAQNLPVMLALVGIWHNQICGYASRAVLPYDQRLVRLPAYLQQLEMESNGKSVAMDGVLLSEHSSALVWGEPGTNGQHAFYQFLHQGTRVTPCEFLLAASGHELDLAHHHLLLAANCLAQSEALMTGRSLAEARALVSATGLTGEDLERQARHRVFPGNRPSTTLLYPRLTPQALGSIVALYEHRVFAEGAILGLNSFDQWGVELGKTLAVSLEPLLRGADDARHTDGSTKALAARIRALREG
jgi:glucose-6-phosphate isomerase